MKRFLLTCVALLLAGVSLQAQNTLYEPTPEVVALGIGPDDDGGHILDFSRVGYRYSDKEIPDVPVVKVLKAPKRGADATARIQKAIDLISALPYEERGAILLKAGRYNVSGQLSIKASGIVLRGEGTDPKNGTHIHSTRTDNGEEAQSVLFMVSGGGKPKYNRPKRMNIIGDVPAGRFWLRVSDVERFSVGSEVVIHAETPMNLIHDLKMDQISPRKGVDPAKMQWNTRTINNKNMLRTVTHIKGDTLWFENPISMSILQKYNGGFVAPYTFEERISECGIEGMRLTCEYTNELDEEHCWTAIAFHSAEHCWARNIDAKYFGMSLAYMHRYAKNITVADCRMTEHKSTLTGSRRYSFLIAGQLCLVRDCYSEDARHAFATSGSRTNGPNVFLRCRAIRTHNDVGPHHRWATGTLYDNVETTGQINIQDRDRLGPGHGWAGVNEVLWNCQGGRVTVQSPWACGRNYSIGTIGKKHPGYCKGRPDGVWVSYGTKVTPLSLYETQLAHRRKLQPNGVFDVK